MVCVYIFVSQAFFHDRGSGRRLAHGVASESRTVGLEDSDNLVTCEQTQSISRNLSQRRLLKRSSTDIRRKLTSDNLDLGNAIGVTKEDTDLRRGDTLAGQLANLLNNLLGGGLQPRRRVARVGDGGGRDALSLAVKSGHFCEVGGGSGDDDERCWGIEKVARRRPIMKMQVGD